MWRYISASMTMLTYPSRWAYSRQHGRTAVRTDGRSCRRPQVRIDSPVSSSSGHISRWPIWNLTSTPNPTSAVPVVGMGVDPLYKRALDSYVPAAAKAQTIQRPTYAPTTATDNGKAAPLIPATTLLSSNAVTPSIAARPIVTPSTTTPIIGTPPLMDQMYGHLETCMTGLETHTNRIVSHCDNANDENAPQTGQSLMAELQAVLALFMTTASNMSVSISQSISSRFQASQTTGIVQATHTMVRSHKVVSKWGARCWHHVYNHLVRV